MFLATYITLPSKNMKETKFCAESKNLDQYSSSKVCNELTILYNYFNNDFVFMISVSTVNNVYIYFDQYNSTRGQVRMKFFQNTKQPTRILYSSCVIKFPRKNSAGKKKKKIGLMQEYRSGRHHKILTKTSVFSYPNEIRDTTE